MADDKFKVEDGTHVTTASVASAGGVYGPGACPYPEEDTITVLPTQREHEIAKGVWDALEACAQKERDREQTAKIYIKELEGRINQAQNDLERQKSALAQSRGLQQVYASALADANAEVERLQPVSVDVKLELTDPGMHPKTIMLTIDSRFGLHADILAVLNRDHFKSYTSARVIASASRSLASSSARGIPKNWDSQYFRFLDSPWIKGSALEQVKAAFESRGLVWSETATSGISIPTLAHDACVVEEAVDTLLEILEVGGVIVLHKCYRCSTPYDASSHPKIRFCGDCAAERVTPGKRAGES